MVMAPGGNLGGNNGSLQPANLPFVPPSNLNVISSPLTIPPPGQIIGTGNLFVSSAGVMTCDAATSVAFRVAGLTRWSVDSTGALQASGASGIRSGTGVPAAGLGNNNDYYFRTDGAGAAASNIYFKTGGAWVGIA